jgi:beta-galactosidase
VYLTECPFPGAKTSIIPPMDLSHFQTLFPLGSHLCREPMPSMSELKHDMELLKRQGFNLVKLQENWAYDEPIEGQIDLSKYEELIEYAVRLDLGVYLGLTCEQAPAWLWRKHPGCRMVGRDGLPIAYEAQMTLPADGKPGPCFDEPGAMADQLRFIRRLVEILGRFENLVVWNTWQEVAYWSERLAGQHVCYCEHTLEHFRRWLAAKYADLDGLNRAWKTRYGDWASVQPDRAATGRECLPQDVDWFYFMDNEHPAATLRARADAIQGADPLKRPVFAHLGGPVIGSGRHWTYARCQDFLGSSCYPAWFPHHPWDDAANRPEAARPLQRQDSLAAEMSFVALTYDQVRSCNPPGSPVWAAEFQGGPVSTGFHKGRIPSPGDIRRWMLTAVASGVTAISFWVSRAEITGAEVNGFSLLDSEGDASDRFMEASRIGQALNKHADLFGAPTLERAAVAVLVHEANYQFCASMTLGGEHLGYSTRGWHRLLWELGFLVDFLEVQELDALYAQDYKVIILPFPLSLSEEVVHKLARFVENGGNLISEAAPGRLNEHAFANRGEMSSAARNLFGVKQSGFQMVREPGSGDRWSPQERTWGEYLEPAILEGCGFMDGHRLRANVYIETFEPVDCQAFLAYGEAAAGCVRNFGKGRAWLLGTYVGHNGTAYRDPASRDFIRQLLNECKVRPPHPGGLLLRKRKLPGKEAWILTNPTGVVLGESVDISGWSSVSDLLGEAVERNGKSVHLAVKGLDVKVLILEM